MNSIIGFAIVLTWAFLLCRHDFLQRSLPNVLTVGGLAAALAIRLVFGELPALLSGVTAAAVCGLLFATVNWMTPRRMQQEASPVGGGDIKMMAAAGAITGVSGMLSLLFYISIAGLFMATVFLLAGLADGARVKHYAHCLLNPRYDRAGGAEGLPAAADERARMPFSPAIALGLICALI